MCVAKVIDSRAERWTEETWSELLQRAPLEPERFVSTSQELRRCRHFPSAQLRNFREASCTARSDSLVDVFLRDESADATSPPRGAEHGALKKQTVDGSVTGLSSTVRMRD